ncbi:uncharacterized protein LOC144175907 [Haemaphysalis longicornis]
MQDTWERTLLYSRFRGSGCGTDQRPTAVLSGLPSTNRVCSTIALVEEDVNCFASGLSQRALGEPAGTYTWPEEEEEVVVDRRVAITATEQQQPRPPTTTVAVLGMYRCRSCPYTTNNKVHMETHVRKHTGERPFACAQCGRRFSDRCNMRRHERKHADPFAAEGMAAAEGMTAAFACGLCPKTFPHRKGLSNHIRTHNREPRVTAGWQTLPR